MTGITYAEKILKDEAEVDWRHSAIDIDRSIRAFNPFPGAVSHCDGMQFKFWNSRVSNSMSLRQSGQVGEVLGFGAESVFIQCGQGVIEVLEMQKPGGKKMSARACLQAQGASSKALRFHKE